MGLGKYILIGGACAVGIISLPIATAVVAGICID